MSLFLLIADELRHLLRRRLVVIVLLSLPVVLAAGSLVQGGDERSPLIFAAFMGSSLAGLVCGAMISTSLIGELQQGAPVLFAIRPIPRGYLLLARFLATVLALLSAMALAMAVGAALSAWLRPEDVGMLAVVRSGLALSLACALLQGSFGVLVGVTTSSMLGGVLLFLFVGVQLGNGTMLLYQELPRWTAWSPLLRDGALVGGAVVLSALLLAIAASIFAKRPL